VNDLKPEWTGETIATFILVPVILGATLAAAVLFFHLWRKLRAHNYHDDAPWALACWVIAAIAAAATVTLTWWGMYPWHAEYHQWTPVSGVVDTIDSRLVSAGDKAMEDKYVVTFVGRTEQYGVLDTRAAGVKSGDRITITCVRRYQWSGSHGYDCNFVSLERAR
jgi:hypothetical protein